MEDQSQVESSMTRVLIAGCGYVGTALGKMLAAEGHAVWGLRRRPELLPQAIAPFRADLCEPSSLAGLPNQLDFVFYLAAADETSDAAYHSVYVVGLANLLEALLEQGQTPKRIFFTSSTAVYAQQDGEWVDENSSTQPDHFSGQRLLEAEQVLLSGPFAATVVRLGGIYGPGRTGLIDSLRLREAARGPGDGAYTNRIHRDDCAGVLIHLMKLPNPEPLYIGVDDEPTARNQMFDWLQKRTRISTQWARPAPVGGLRRSSGNKRCSNRRLVASGYVFRYPTFREGYAAVLGQTDEPKLS
jgi:nucleoside-diphosphate-sugar epimerase